jgi:hypothetical protein
MACLVSSLRVDASEQKCLRVQPSIYNLLFGFLLGSVPEKADEILCTKLRSEREVFDRSLRPERATTV